VIGQRARIQRSGARHVGLRPWRAAAVHSTPGKPIENAFVESFNGKVRDECLNEHWFASVAEARTLIETWRVDYNTIRPHSALHGATPEQFANSLCGRSPAQTPARADWKHKDTKNEQTKPEDLSLSG
jgi:putative transposase